MNCAYCQEELTEANQSIVRNFCRSCFKKPRPKFRMNKPKERKIFEPSKKPKSVVVQQLQQKLGANGSGYCLTCNDEITELNHSVIDNCCASCVRDYKHKLATPKKSFGQTPLKRNKANATQS